MNYSGLEPEISFEKQIFLPLRLSSPNKFVVWTLPSSVLDAHRQVSTPYILFNRKMDWLGVAMFYRTMVSPNLMGFIYGIPAI